MLHGRDAERAAIAALLDGARAARGGSLVVHGLPGVGKSALLAEAAAVADGMQVLRTQGVESESPLAFAALHRLLRPVGSAVGRLPPRQARALRAAFGEEDGGPDIDRFAVFLGVLSLLAEVAVDAPVLAVVDDAHWLDDASAAALLFAARRVSAERIALLFAARDGDVRRFESDLPTLPVAGLGAADAVALLTERAGVPVPAAVGARIVALTGGNPLALAELPGVLATHQLSGEAPLPSRLPVSDGVERVFLDRARRLPDPARTLLLVAAADDSGRIATVQKAASVLGIGGSALDAVEASGLLRIRDGEVELRHPLVRSAVYTAATSTARRRAHRALAEVLDGDRRTWHRAAAAEDVDVQVADDLEGVAARARGRGGQEAASAALERAAELTPPGDGRVRRRHAAAFAAWLGGRPLRARMLADAALAEASDPHLRADVALLRARVEWNTGSLDLGHRMVLTAAGEIAPADLERARELGMFAAALASVGAAGGAGPDPAALVPPADEHSSTRVRCVDGLLRGLTGVAHRDWGDAAQHLRAALVVSAELDPAEFDAAEQDVLPNLAIGAMHLHDDDALGDLYGRLLTRARAAGATIMVLYALGRRALTLISTGRWARARADLAEARLLADGIGRPGLAALPAALTALLAALRGEIGGDDVDALLADVDRLAARPAGTVTHLVHDVAAWTRGLAAADDPATALHHLERMSLPVTQQLAALDRLDAAARAQRHDLAATWIADLTRFADGTGSPWAAAVTAHGQALLAPHDEAERHFRTALAHHSRSPRPVDAARTRLALGEHLRRARRRVDARAELRGALTVLDDVGAGPWAERARRELRASGETARRRDTTAETALTPQELQVAALVADGMSNREVAGRLFVSPRTVDFHLRNVFTKLAISSRGELTRVVLR
ncbi:MAG: AAA family ATPase [Pseudonocardia sp.]